MGAVLDRPDKADDLYIERGPMAAPWRPVMQGDVFEGATVPNAAAHQAVIVISHPCTMRAGAELKPVLQAAPVTPYREIEPAAWESGHFRMIPLSELRPDAETDTDRHCAARLDQTGLVRTEDLDLERRIACLSDSGILLLQQRFVFCLTRALIRLKTLDEASRPVLDEIELLEEWNEGVAAPRCEAGEDRGTVLAQEAVSFDALLSEPTDDPLRAMLDTSSGRAAVRRTVRQEIAARQEAAAATGS